MLSYMRVHISVKRMCKISVQFGSAQLFYANTSTPIHKLTYINATETEFNMLITIAMDCTIVFEGVGREEMEAKATCSAAFAGSKARTESLHS